MINLHDKAITELLPRIGPKAFSVLLVICKHLNRKNTAFPSKLTIMKLTNMGRDAVTRELSVLEDAGLLRKEQRNKAGKFSTNLYTVTTNLIGVYVPAIDAGEMEEEPCTESQATVNTSPCTESPCTESPSSESQSTISIKQKGSIEQKKVLKAHTQSASEIVNTSEWMQTSTDRVTEAISTVKSHFQKNPSLRRELCEMARIQLNDEQVEEEAEKWLRWNGDNYPVIQYPVKSLTSGRSNFLSWMFRIKTTNHETTNSTTNGRVQQQRKASAFLSPDERKRRLGLL